MSSYTHPPLTGQKTETEEDWFAQVPQNVEAEVQIWGVRSLSEAGG